MCRATTNRSVCSERSILPAVPSPTIDPPTGDNTMAQRYLDLLKGCLTRDLFPDDEVLDVLHWQPSEVLGPPNDVWDVLHANGWRLVRRMSADDRSTIGQDWIPGSAETMVSRARLDNVEALVRRVVAEGVRGDLVETGVWRGGTVILMKAVLATLGVTDRTVWVCDSFQGLPEPDPDRYPADASMQVSNPDAKAILDLGLAVSVEQVKANFARYGLLDDQVRFVEGWFSESLPTAPIGDVAVLRLDGDLYESTMDALVNLEPRVSPGGFVIIDDYGCIPACQEAVHDYRKKHSIEAEIHPVDWTGAYWRKPLG